MRPTPYENLQQAMLDASERDARVWAERRRLRAKCALLLQELIQRFRIDLGLLSDDATSQVFFCDPTVQNPAPDEPGRALRTHLLDHTIRLDVVIKNANGRIARILYFMLKIRECSETKYQLTFEGGREDHIMFVDTADPRTFTQCSNELIAAMLDWFNTDIVGRDSRYVRSPVGFAPGASVTDTPSETVAD